MSRLLSVLLSGLVFAGLLVGVWLVGQRFLAPDAPTDEGKSDSVSSRTVALREQARCPEVLTDVLQAVMVARDGGTVCGLDLSEQGYPYVTRGIRYVSGLTVLDLHKNALTELPPWLGEVESLREINVAFNELARLPDEIGALSQLERLVVTGNPLSDVEVERIRALLPQTEVVF